MIGMSYLVSPDVKPKGFEVFVFHGHAFDLFGVAEDRGGLKKGPGLFQFSHSGAVAGQVVGDEPVLGEFAGGRQ